MSVAGLSNVHFKRRAPWQGQRPDPIPAWGFAPGDPKQTPQGLKARPIRRESIPHVSLIIFHAVFFQKHAELLLKRPPLVMLFLPLNIFAQRIQIRRADRKAAVAALPRERAKARRLRLQPFGRRGFQLFHQVRDGKRAREPNREMHMIPDPTDAIRLASRVARDGGEVSVEFWASSGIEQRSTLLRAENNVDDDEAQRLRHDAGVAANRARGQPAVDGTGFQPSFIFHTNPGAKPQAGMDCAVGAQAHVFDALLRAGAAKRSFGDKRVPKVELGNELKNLSPYTPI